MNSREKTKNTRGIRTFRDLIAWQRGMELARKLYQTTAQMSPTERFGLIDQMRKAAVSIPSNIAEEYARQSTRDYIKFLRIARGSLAELMTQVELATTLNLLPPNERLTSLLKEENRILQALIRSLEKTIPK